MRVVVYDLVKGGAGRPVEDLAGFLRSTLLRLRSSMHAETRVYTCAAWAAGTAEPYELHWNARDVPGERFIGTLSPVSRSVYVEVAALLEAGTAVRLFTFNSDADLCFQDVLVGE